jgi:hypothetical protein
MNDLTRAQASAQLVTFILNMTGFRSRHLVFLAVTSPVSDD